MKRITRIIRPIICMAVLLFAMTTAVMGCYQKGTEPVSYTHLDVYKRQISLIS